MTEKVKQFRGNDIIWNGKGIYWYISRLQVWQRVTSIETMEKVMEKDYSTAFITEDDLTSEA